MFRFRAHEKNLQLQVNKPNLRFMSSVDQKNQKNIGILIIAISFSCAHVDLAEKMTKQSPAHPNAKEAKLQPDWVYFQNILKEPTVVSPKKDANPALEHVHSHTSGKNSENSATHSIVLMKNLLPGRSRGEQ